jgi:alpha/beta superfamily hydrolase
MTEREKPILIPSGDLQLEGRLSVRDTKGEVFVLCHPHPQYGGDMDNNVVMTMVEAFGERGLSTLRFNFRGVGQSQGRFGEGIDERLDVEAAIDFLEAHLKPRRIHVGGYSFGAHVGLYVASVDSRVDGFVAVAPPLALYDFDFVGDHTGRKLLIAGAEDAFCPPGRLEEWVASLKEPKVLRVIPGADHFFWGKEEALKEALGDYFSAPSD